MSTPPEKGVDDFLAAPEEVVQNPREAAKLQDRKEKDRARLERERWNKSKERPTLEDILTDMVRVAEDEATNPWHEFRSLSKRRYELYGHYPIEYVLQEAGRFSHAKEMAGLQDAEGDRALLNARTQQSKREHDARYFNRYIAPHVDKYPELRRATAKAKMAVWISDTHSLFMDPFTWITFLAFLEDAQPEVVVWGGDHVDGSQISSHPKVPGFTTPFQTELDVLKFMWREARERSTARFVWIESNHFMPRFVRFLTQHAQALSSLRTLRIDKLLEFDDLDIEIVQPGTFLSPAGQEDKRPMIKLWDRITTTHGTKIGQYQARDELLHWGASGWSGHCHRDQLTIGPAAGLRQHRWLSCPGAVTDEVAKYYVPGNKPAWSRGFAIAEMMGKGLQLTPAITTDGVCMVNGWYYEQKGKLPKGVEPVRKFWRKRWNLR